MDRICKKNKIHILNGYGDSNCDSWGIVGGLNSYLLNPRIFVFYVTCACNLNTFETILLACTWLDFYESKVFKLTKENITSKSGKFRRVHSYESLIGKFFKNLLYMYGGVRIKLYVMGHKTLKNISVPFLKYTLLFWSIITFFLKTKKSWLIKSLCCLYILQVYLLKQFKEPGVRANHYRPHQSRTFSFLWSITRTWQRSEFVDESFTSATQVIVLIDMWWWSFRKSAAFLK